MYVFDVIEGKIENVQKFDVIKHLRLPQENGAKVYVAYIKSGVDGNLKYKILRNKSEILQCLKNNMCTIYELIIGKTKFIYRVTNSVTGVVLESNTKPDARDSLISAYNELVRTIKLNDIDYFNIVRQEGLEVKEIGGKLTDLSELKDVDEFTLVRAEMFYISVDRVYNRMYYITSVNSSLVSEFLNMINC